ncbi:MAG: sporulation protein YqfC [Clostridia bacterium]|nr:sporulation protein YqfC [Clostridia bacterium]
MSKSRLKSFMTDSLELPKEIVTDLSRVSIFSNNEIYIENYKGLIEFETDRAKINTKGKIISLNGKGFEIKNITEDEITLKGEIYKITFE